MSCDQAKSWGRKYKCEERGESGICDSREMPVVWARSDPTDTVAQTSPNHPAKMAAVRLVGTLSNRDAVGARLTLLAGSEEEGGGRAVHAWVHSANGFQSQNSQWVLLPLGVAAQRTLEVLWPAGTKQTVALQAWTRTVRHKPEPTAKERSELAEGEAVLTIAGLGRWWRSRQRVRRRTVGCVRATRRRMSPTR